MVFVWGHKGYHDLLGYIIWECPECGTTGAFSVVQARKKFTVYFIPTFSYSQKQFLVCTTCQATFEVPKELKLEIAKNLMSQEELSSLIRELNEKTTEPEKQTKAITTESSSSKNLHKKRAREEKNVTNYCPSCGNEVGEKMSYCSQCGRKLKR